MCCSVITERKIHTMKIVFSKHERALTYKQALSIFHTPGSSVSFNHLTQLITTQLKKFRIFCVNLYSQKKKKKKVNILNSIFLPLLRKESIEIGSNFLMYSFQQISMFYSPSCPKKLILT
ncbi:unnamed protein product [Nezara viridula]|uniref:Uncharacterized protein n=1 Tax=Nezara viridula TaxID=85310 RepID=A0A9P0E2E7_NEZVI|nr:unnamed protein product [Nezara viridula]